MTGLVGKENTNPYDLSPTWRKMVALASILAMDTPIVILDEPTTGQDAASIQRIAEIVAELQRSGKSVLTITHDIDFCAENFKRLVVMGRGKVLTRRADAPNPGARRYSEVDLCRSATARPPGTGPGFTGHRLQPGGII